MVKVYFKKLKGGGEAVLVKGTPTLLTSILKINYQIHGI